ncbi:MAG: DUF2341 domain-containing protein [Planctomycetes bacterium]|nr:DUF2341 domain-containing protein [Planctomycetota bacterium]
MFTARVFVFFALTAIQLLPPAAALADEWAQELWTNEDFISMDGTQVSAQKVRLSEIGWQNPGPSTWTYRMPVVIQNPSATESLPVNYTIHAPAALSELLDNSLCRADFNDIRVMYRNPDNASQWSEIDRLLPASNAVFFNDGNPQFLVNNFTAAGQSALTVEAYVYLTANPEPNRAATIFLEQSSNFGINRVFLGITYGLNVLWEIEGAGQFVSLGSTLTVPMNAWTHIAGCYDSTGLRIYINGMPAGSRSDNPGILGDSPQTAWINSPCFLLAYTTLKGGIDELRVSSSVRYQDAFDIRRAQFESDANTLSLWHFNESGGGTVWDAAYERTASLTGICAFLAGFVYSNEVLFKTPGNFSLTPSGISADNFWIYYGNPSADPAPQAPGNVYLFYDDFNGGTIDPIKWADISPDFSIQNGVLVREIANPTISSLKTNPANGYSFNNFQLEFTFRPGPIGMDGTIFQYADEMDTIISMVSFQTTYRISGSANSYDNYVPNTDYSARITLNGTVMSYYINNQLKLVGEIINPQSAYLRTGSSISAFWGKYSIDNYTVSSSMSPGPVVLAGLAETQTFFYTQGSCVSKTFDTQLADCRIETASKTWTGSGSVLLYVRASNDSEWFAANPDDGWLQAPEDTGLAKGRYLQYKLELYGNGGTGEPYMDKVSVIYNVPPERPGNVSPVNGEIIDTLLPIFYAGPFIDPNPGDSLYASNWQFRTANGTYDNPAIDITKTYGSVSILAFEQELFAPDTLYFWRVRYKDNHADYAGSAWSEFSYETFFDIYLGPPPGQIQDLPVTPGPIQDLPSTPEGPPVQDENSVVPGPEGQNNADAGNDAAEPVQVFDSQENQVSLQDGGPSIDSSPGDASVPVITNIDITADVDSGTDVVSLFPQDTGAETGQESQPALTDTMPEDPALPETPPETPPASAGHGKNSGRCFIKTLLK